MASAPNAIALAASTPSRMPPALISCTTPYSPHSSRAALVDADREVALFGDRARDFGAQQQPPGSGLGALSDRQLDRVGHAHVMHVDAVAGRQDLVDQRAAVLPLGHQHAAVAGGVRGA